MCVQSKPESAEVPEIMQFVSMLSGRNRWRGEIIPDVIGTAKLTQAVTLQPRQVHLVWAKLPAASPLSEGSAILIEPSKTQIHKKKIICRSVTSMSGDRWVPVRILNTSEKPLTLKRNTKIADVSLCIAVEDLEDGCPGHAPAKKIELQTQTSCDETTGKLDEPICSSFHDTLSNTGLEDLDIDSCQVSNHWKLQLLQLGQKYEDVFSKSKLNCWTAKDFVHRLH